VRQLDAYFAGELRVFDLPLRLDGTPFQRSVWEQLRLIPYGGDPLVRRTRREPRQARGSRAVGLANGKNPVGIIVPCHRVIGASGGLTGYGGGLDRKQRLLAFENGTEESAPALF
ncbi:methylated-DNA--[protein]-cysteine S-methyltransferase, partial [Streptomyces sp. SID7803]|nr:methylated-DNA--[protein]-cysteine S-methyltransferase [Streptomyces sp. SID7803]